MNKQEQLEKLLSQKKSKAYYSKKLGIPESEVEVLIKQIKQPSKEENIKEDEKTFNYDLEKEEIKVSKLWTFAPKPEDVIKEHQIDETRWKLAQIWIKQTSKGYLTSAAFSPKKPTEITQKEFVEIIKATNPLPRVFKNTQKGNLPKAALIIPKQDAHFDKFDIHGNNDINSRFEKVETAISKIVKKATVSNTLEKITYIVGSDQFNSEWTQQTTKGTPQVNILPYHEAFQKIGEHESTVINFLLENAEKVDVLYIPGNHDHYVGWHLVNWLQALFIKNNRVTFDTNPINRKYERYYNTGLMFNHGDELKGRDLAHKFPMEFKDEWSKCEHFAVFTGDKHHELTQDIHGIKFYQVPSLSSSKSFWDDKKGFTCTKAEMVCFLVTSSNGISDVYKEVL